jgi:hypothetical protein
MTLLLELACLAVPVERQSWGLASCLESPQFFEDLVGSAVKLPFQSDHSQPAIRGLGDQPIGGSHSLHAGKAQPQDGQQ